jgi:hypothetical protein
MKKILCFVLAVAMIFIPVVSVSAFADIDPENKYKYEDIILPEFFDEDELEEPLIEIYYSERASLFHVYDGVNQVWKDPVSMWVYKTSDNAWHQVGQVLVYPWSDI